MFSWVFPPLVVATFGRLALFSGVGPVGRAAEAPGFGNSGLLLLDDRVLLCVAVLVDAWRTVPFVALLRITLPLLKPALLGVLLLRFLDAFRVFDLFRVLGNQNLGSLSTYVYQDVMLSQINFGLGNAAAVFMFLCALRTSLTFVLRAQASISPLRCGSCFPVLPCIFGHADRSSVGPHRARGRNRP